MEPVQLSFHIPSYVKYSPEDYYLHQGVRELFQSVSSLACQKTALSFFIRGDARSGKSHLSFSLADQISEKGFVPRLLSGYELSEWLDELPLTDRTLLQEIVLIDDADKYFLRKSEGESGQFVSLMEFCKAHKVPVILLSSLSPEDFPCDAHIMSRIRSAAFFEIGMPSDAEMGDLLLILAKQRGLQLSQRKIEFLTRRLGRSIQELEHYLDRLLYLSDVLGRSAKFDLLNDAL